MAKIQKVLFGGSFPHPIDKGKLVDYRNIAEATGGPVGEAMLALVQLVSHYHTGSRKPTQRGVMMMLASDEAERLDEHIPWDHEIAAVQKLFDGLPSGVVEDGTKVVEDRVGQTKTVKANRVTNQKAYDLRNAAFHLLWYAKELGAGREPMTKDRL